MLKVSFKAPVNVDAKTVELQFPNDDYLSLSLQDADGNVLAQHEDGPGPLAPFIEPLAKGPSFHFDIDLETGSILNWKKPEGDAIARIEGAGQATVLGIHAKVRDTFAFRLKDKDGAVFAEQREEYVPSFMPGEHYGDYVILNIAIETGTILGWKRKCTPNRINELLESENTQLFWPPVARR